MPIEYKEEIRTTIMNWIVNCVDQVAASPPYIRSKVAVIIAITIKNDFPEVWPSAFEDLIKLMPANPLQTEMALRALIAVDEEVVDKSLPRRYFTTY